MWQMAKNKSIGISEFLKTRIPAFAIHFYKNNNPNAINVGTERIVIEREILSKLSDKLQNSKRY